MKNYKMVAVLAAPIGVAALVAKPVLATEAAPRLAAGQAPIVLAQRYDGQQYNDRRNRYWREEQRREAQREESRREELRRNWTRGGNAQQNVIRYGSPKYDPRYDSRYGSPGYGSRRVWVPGHYESGFLGIGRKWVEGHWADR